MKKLLTLTLLSLFALCLHAQNGSQDVNGVDNGPIEKAIVPKSAMVRAKASYSLSVRDVAFKTSASRYDTLTDYMNRLCDEIDTCCVDSSTFFYPNALPWGGYLNGTQGFAEFTSGGQTVQRVVSEHGMSFTCPEPGENESVRLSSVYVYFTFQSAVIEDPDEFTLNVTDMPGANPVTASPRVNPMYSMPFTAEDFGAYPSWPYIPTTIEPTYETIFNNPDYFELVIPNDTNVEMIGRKLISIEVGREGNDDTLAIWFKNRGGICDPTGQDDWWIRLRDEEWAHVRWQKFNDTYFDGTEEPYELSDGIHIIPILEFEEQQVSNDKAFATSGGLKLLSAVPNPATTSTALRYELESPTRVTIRVRDMAGRTVHTSPSFFQTAGAQAYDVNVSGLASGVYTYIIETDNGRLASRFSVTR